MISAPAIEQTQWVRPAPVSTHDTHQTSAQALHSQSLRRIKGKQDAVVNILTLALGRGVSDMTTLEIARQHEDDMGNGYRTSSSSFTAAVQQLLLAKKIERLPDSRICNVSKHQATALRLVSGVGK